LLLSPTYIPEGREVKGHVLPVRDGAFELPGCDPGKGVRVWFYDPRAKEGACVELSARPGAAPEVRLAPCVSARVRFLDADGKLITRPRIMLDLVLRPGDSTNESLRKGTNPRISVRGTVFYGRDSDPTQADDAGKVTLANLIPGGTYVIRAEEQLGWP